MANTGVSGSINTRMRGTPYYIEHDGLVSGQQAYVGMAVAVSGSTTANSLYVQQMTGSNTTYVNAGVITSYNPKLEGVAASANGAHKGHFRIAAGCEFAFKNGNPDVAGYELASNDVGKVCYGIDGSHVARSGSRGGGNTPEQIAGIVTEVESTTSDGTVWVLMNNLRDRT